MNIAVETERLTKSFGTVQALGGVDLVVPCGSVVGLLGPNGAGKTTVIRVLSTLLRPDGGRAFVGGYDVTRNPAEVRGLIGLTGQYAAVDELLSGANNLCMIGRLLGMSNREARQRAVELLEDFELVHAGQKIVKNYSGGMRRRLDLAASLVGHPSILYLDEPTTGLDPHSRLQLWSLIRTLVDDGTTVLLTTQYLDEVDRLAHEIVVMDDGRVIAAGTANELKATVGGLVLQLRPANPGNVPAAAGILTDFASMQGSVYQDSHLVSLPITDRSVLAAAVRRLDDAGIALDDLTLRRPSLDEVFLALTGHAAEAEPQPVEDSSAKGRTV